MSLEAGYAEAFLERAKCHFLLGDTEKGFSSLKVFMELNPEDMSIYKWIGSLLYEGYSYRDAIKAYEELGDRPALDVQLMKIKCMLRVAGLGDVQAAIKNLEKEEHSQKDREKVAVDTTAVALLQTLVKGDSSAKAINSLTKRLNKHLEESSVGHVFQLIDCMNLLGVASFHLEKYSDAYESFLLVLELFRSLSEKNVFLLKSESAEEDLDLKIEDIYLNLVVTELAQGNRKQGLAMLMEEYLDCQTDPKKIALVKKAGKSLERESEEVVELGNRMDRPVNSRIKKVDLLLGKQTIVLCDSCDRDASRASVATTNR